MRQLQEELNSVKKGLLTLHAANVALASSMSAHSMPSSSSRRLRSQRRPTRTRLPRHTTCQHLHSRAVCSITMHIISPCSQSLESREEGPGRAGRKGLDLSSCQ